MTKTDGQGIGRMLRASWPIGLAVTVAVAAASCGGDGDTSSSQTGTQTGMGGEAGQGAGTGANGGGGTGGTGGTGGGGAPPVDVLARESKSSTIDVNNDDTLVAMVNPGDDTVSIFDTSDNARISRVNVGASPSSLVFHPNGETIYVANRGEPSITIITNASSANPVAMVFNNATVGSEPTGLALSPTGKYLAVAEWGEGAVSIWETATGELLDTVAVANPRSVAFTNNLDDNDDDELLVVPEFYGVPDGTVTDLSGPETSDSGRNGVVRTFTVPALAPDAVITLNSRDSGMVAATGTSPNQIITSSGSGTGVTASPNQLWSVAVVGQKIYIPAIAVSPKAPVNVGSNIQPIVYVADLGTGTEDTTNVGTTNLAREVFDKTFTVLAVTDKLFLADIVDVSFVGTNLAYVLSRGADTLQRVEYNAATGVEIGAPGLPEQIQLSGTGVATPCRIPSGVVTGHGNATAYINCEFDRDLGVVDLTQQAIVAKTESWPDPTVDSVEDHINQGFRVFFTARGRWARQGYSDCGSCHPDGLSDNITWQFAAGPRQTTSCDGSFSKSDQKQRIFNWTGIFDELHDFERNTRDTSGGRGAIVTAPTQGECGTNTETQASLAGINGLAKPLKEINEDLPIVCNTDWDDMTDFLAAIRPPMARQRLLPADVTAGAALFLQGNCNYCHGGSGWTLSRLYWTPDGNDNIQNTNSDLSLLAFFTQPADWPASWSYDVLNQIANQPGGILDDGTGPVEPTGIGPVRVVCAMRNVGTFGVAGNTVLTDGLELKADGTRAQGRGGYNIPSLYGLQVGAPYLHHGQAGTLTDLFTQAAWQDHLQAGNAVFAPTTAQIAQLVAYLLSIDEDAAEVQPPLPVDFEAEGCPLTFGTAD